MTYLEKYQEDHADRIPALPTMVDGVKKFICPSDYGYEQDDYACDEMGSCAECWCREMEVEK